MLRETLDDSTTTHDDGSSHDAPPTAEALVAVGSNGDRENGAELVAGGDETEESSLNSPLAIGILVALAEVCTDQYLFHGKDLHCNVHLLKG